MIRGIDHLVIACPDPDAAAQELTDRRLLAVTGGGRHDRFGTRNRIAWLADGSYLELIGIDDRSLVESSPVAIAAAAVIDERGAGLATFALADDGIVATTAGLRATGSSYGDVTHGSRTRADGELVEWWAAFPDHPLGPQAAPFLIEHASAGPEWGTDALAERARFSHPIGSPVRLVGVDIAADDPVDAAARLHAETGLDVFAVADLAVCQIGPHVVRYRPSREMAVPAAVRLSAAIDAPRTMELLGVRFDVERAELPVSAG